MSLKSLIDNPKELLELISECLKPKDVEKKQFGEVFTPMILVNEMLDKLPIEVWKNKNLKWNKCKKAIKELSNRINLLFKSSGTER